MGSQPPGQWPDFTGLIEEAAHSLLNNHADLFMGYGLTLFKALAITLIVWLGIKTALGAAEGGGIGIKEFVKTIFFFLFGWVLLKYYHSPVEGLNVIPGLGFCTTDLFLKQSEHLIGIIGKARIEEVWQHSQWTVHNLEMPGLGQVHFFAQWILLELVVILADCAMFLIIGYAYIALAVLLLVGPLFIPFLIVPRLDFLFWSWLRATIQYTFMGFIAACYVFVFGQSMIRAHAYLGIDPETLIKVDTWATSWPLQMILYCVFAFGMLKVPSLTSDLFIGSAAAVHTGFIQTVTAMGARAGFVVGGGAVGGAGAAAAAAAGSGGAKAALPAHKV